MPKLKLSITNQAGAVTGEYTIDCVDRPGFDGERYDSLYVINQVRVAAERHQFLKDFAIAPTLSNDAPTFLLDANDPLRAFHLENVNELWFEIENLLNGARLNFATSRMLKKLEDSTGTSTSIEENMRAELHLDKLERFNVAVFEMARIEDLVVRIVHEFFSGQLIEVDTSKDAWEKRLTWDNMKDALNKKSDSGEPSFPNAHLLSSEQYDALMKLIRGYRSQEVKKLTRYRDRRTHRVAPSVDHIKFSADVKTVPKLDSGSPIQLMAGQQSEPEYDFLQLYENAKKVYAQLSKLLTGLNELMHA